MRFRFFPAYHELFQSALSAEEVLSLVDGLTKQRQTLTAHVFATGDEAWYAGEVVGHIFRLRRRLSYRNDFRPLIHGDVYPTHDGRAEVDLQMHLPLGIKVFLSAWVGTSGLLPIGNDVPKAIHLWRLGFAFDWSVFTPLLIGCGGYAFVAGAFYLQARTSRRHLIKMLQLVQQL